MQTYRLYRGWWRYLNKQSSSIVRNTCKLTLLAFKHTYLYVCDYSVFGADLFSKRWSRTSSCDWTFTVPIIYAASSIVICIVCKCNIMRMSRKVFFVYDMCIKYIYTYLPHLYGFLGGSWTRSLNKYWIIYSVGWIVE